MVNIDLTRFSYEAIGVWIVAFFVMEFPMRAIYLAWPNSPFLQRWYGFKEFSPYNVVIGDLFYMSVALIMAYRIHSYVAAHFKLSSYWARFASLFAILWIIQIIGDILFYQIITRIPNASQNKWLKFFIDYGNSAGFIAVWGDSLYILIWTLTVCFVQYLPHDIMLGLMFFYVFILSIYAEAK